VTLAPSDAGLPVGTVTLTAMGGPVSLYSISIAASADGALAVSPSTGTLFAGQSVTLTLSLTKVMNLDTEIFIDPGDVTITVLYSAPRIDN
jgi:hypothetical protein